MQHVPARSLRWLWAVSKAFVLPLGPTSLPGDEKILVKLQAPKIEALYCFSPAKMLGFGHCKSGILLAMGTTTDHKTVVNLKRYRED